MVKRLVLTAALPVGLFWSSPAQAQYVVENLGRAVVAVRSSETQVYVGWRMLGTDPANIAFNLYRVTGDEVAMKLNSAPLTATTDFVDTTADLSRGNSYTVRPVLG